jgi:D-alanine--D-alanine ligase
VSDEYEISLRTGSAVLTSLDTTRFEPLDIIITKGGEWLHHGRVRYPEHVLSAVDIVFNALHGTYGEDGTLQRLLDRFGVRYTGSGAYASGLAMHKGYTKEHLKETGILLPKHYVVRGTDVHSPQLTAHHIQELFGPMYVLKPVASGSSLGVEIVRTPQHLGQSLEQILTQFDEVLVEEFIEGREVTCGVIERFRDSALYALPPIEIIHAPHHDFFSYDAKYDGSTNEVCPAQLPISDKRIIEEAARRIHQSLHLRQYSRSDFILAPDGLYFLEVNTLPGLTKESLMPKALYAVGSSHMEFVEHLVNDALQHA